jgi:DNA-binding GntR family transcriptional regulator
MESRSGVTPFDALSASRGDDGDRQKGHLSGSTTAMLRTLIITGALAAGQKLRERELCERLGVSRTPIREAIKTLTQEGLIKALPNRSPVVTAVDRDEVRSLAEVLAALEGLACELAARTATDEEIAEIAALNRELVAHHSRDELPDYFRVNKAIHRKLVEASRNPVLLWVWDLIALRVDRARYVSNLWPQRWPEAVKEHQAMLDQLVRRDGETLAALMRAHVRNGLSVVADGRAAAARSASGAGIAENA